MSQVVGFFQEYYDYSRIVYKSSHPHILVDGYISPSIVRSLIKEFQPIIQEEEISRDTLYYKIQSLLIKRETPDELQNWLSKDILLQSNYEPSDEVISTLESSKGYSRSHMYLIRGSLSIIDDLERSSARSAGTIVVLPAAFSERSDDPDILELKDLTSYPLNRVPSSTRSGDYPFSRQDAIVSNREVDDLHHIMIKRDYSAVLRTWSALRETPTETPVCTVLFHSVSKSLVTQAFASLRKSVEGGETIIDEEDEYVDVFMKHGSKCTRECEEAKDEPVGGTVFCADEYIQSITACSSVVYGFASLFSIMVIGEGVMLVSFIFLCYSNHFVYEAIQMRES